MSELTPLSDAEVKKMKKAPLEDARIDAKGNFVKEIAPDDLFIDRSGVTLGERATRNAKESLTNALAAFYIDVFIELNQNKSLVDFYRENEEELKPLSFGQMVIGFAVLEEKRTREVVTRINDSRRVYDRIVLLTKQLLEDHMAGNPLDATLAALEGAVAALNHSDLSKEVKKIIKDHEEGRPLEVANDLKAIKKWAKAKKQHIGIYRTSPAFNIEWSTLAFPIPPAAPKSKMPWDFLKSDPITPWQLLVEKHKLFDAASTKFASVCRKCHVYMQNLFEQPTKNLRVDHHYIKPKETKAFIADSAEYATKHGFYYDFGNIQTRERALVKFEMRDMLDERNAEDFVEIIGRLKTRFDMVDMIAEEVIKHSKRDTAKLIERKLETFVRGVCTVFDYYMNKNLLDLPLFRLSKASTEKIVNALVSLQDAEFTEHVLHSSLEDSYESISESGDENDDDSDIERQLESGDSFDEDFQDSGADSDDDLAEMFRHKENAREDKVRELITKKRNPQRAEPVEANDGDDISQPERVVTIEAAKQRERQWAPFFQRLDRYGIDLSALFESIQRDLKRHGAEETTGDFLTVTWKFIEHNEELVYGKEIDANENNITSELDEAIQMGQYAKDIIDQKADYVRWAEADNPNPDRRTFIRFKAEIWALAYVLQQKDRVKWTPDACRYDSAFHVYRVFHLEFQQGFFGFKYQNGIFLSEAAVDLGDLKDIFMEFGFPTNMPLSAADLRASMTNFKKDEDKWEACREELILKSGLTLAEQFWYLLPEAFKEYCRQLARAFEPQTGVAWWHSANATGREATLWLHGNELFRKVVRMLQSPRADEARKTGWMSNFFGTSLTIMKRTKEYIEECPTNWKKKIAEQSQTYCRNIDGSIRRKVVSLVNKVWGQFGDTPFRLTLRTFLYTRMKAFDCPVTLEAGKRHYDNDEHRGHANAIEYGGVSNFLLAIAHTMAVGKSSADSAMTPFWRVTNGVELFLPVDEIGLEDSGSDDESDEDEENNLRGSKRVHPDSSEDEEDEKKAKRQKIFQVRAQLFRRFQQ